MTCMAILHNGLYKRFDKHPSSTHMYFIHQQYCLHKVSCLAVVVIVYEGAFFYWHANWLSSMFLYTAR